MDTNNIFIIRSAVPPPRERRSASSSSSDSDDQLTDKIYQHLSKRDLYSRLRSDTQLSLKIINKCERNLIKK